jgi:hypothetical protein
MTLSDRLWINQYDPVVLGMHVYVRGQVGDPDSNLVQVTMTNEVTGAPVFTNRAATRADVGAYEIQLTSEETAEIGPFTLNWHYALDAMPESFTTPVQIGEFSPDYANLSDGMKGIVEQGWNRFEDLFDSPLGGPNLQVYAQSHFNRGRIAQLLRFAVGRLNTAAQPYQTYTLDGDGGAAFPIAAWGALLEQALYVEILKHLRRSYVEQPLLMGGEVTRHDRRDYMDRWSQVLQDEQTQLKEQLDVFKIRAMGLGRPAVLVSGGAYGRSPSGVRYMGTRGRPRFYRPGLY